MDKRLEHAPNKRHKQMANKYIKINHGEMQIKTIIHPLGSTSKHNNYSEIDNIKLLIRMWSD